MTINRNNFEEYLLDYLEGNLDPVLTAELMAFLAENPGYEKYLPEGDLQSVISEDDFFSEKQLLRKDFKDITEINETNFDEFCIAEAEGLLAKDDKERLKVYIGEDPHKMKNIELFRSLKLQPDYTTEFAGKHKLRKSYGFYRPVRFIGYGLAVAASVAILLMLIFDRPAADPVNQDSVTVSENKNVDKDENFNDNTVPDPNVKTPPSRAKNTIPDQPLTSVYVTVDTSVQQAIQKEFITALNPIVRNIPSPENEFDIALLQSTIKEEPPEVNPRRRFEVESNNLFAELFSKVNFWKTAETAINGFNYLTEARLDIDKITDDQGRITRLKVNTERYTITGNLK